MGGIAMVRLLKPLDFYKKKYDTWQYGLHKMYLLMEKQHNRGQEGAGLATVKLDVAPGEEYIWRERIEGKNAIQDIFKNIGEKLNVENGIDWDDPVVAKEHLPFAGEIYLGHLRYSSTNWSGTSYVHPFLRRHNWKARTLLLAGNFNLTNVDNLFERLLHQGQHPRNKAATFLILESLGNKLDNEVQAEYNEIKKRYSNDIVITRKIEEQIDIPSFIRKSEKHWDGGYVMSGVLGHGDAFAFRDPNGVRTAFYYHDDEVAVVTSERAALQTVMGVNTEDIKELEPGEIIIIKRDGKVYFDKIRIPDKPKKACSFERIYISRGSDVDIYKERKELGASLSDDILKAIDYDLENSVFSFIPNTAEVAFYGMTQGIKKITGVDPHIEKVLIKDIKLRTFISQNKERNDLAKHVYDVTWDSIRRGKKDTLVVIDDSIVRGTTLKQSILSIINRLEPKKIVVVSSSPQVRYPDYYGIDMSKMSEFAAFRAAISLLKEQNKQCIIDDVYQKCKAQINLPHEEQVNYVKEIYDQFSLEEISNQIAKILTPYEVDCPVEIVFQTVEGLHKACPNHLGDWYFTGDYPTAGGTALANKAFIKYYEQKEEQ